MSVPVSSGPYGSKPAISEGEGEPQAAVLARVSVGRMHALVRRIERHRVAAVRHVAAAAVGKGDRPGRVGHCVDRIVDIGRVRIISLVVDRAAVAQVLEVVAVGAVADAVDIGRQAAVGHRRIGVDVDAATDRERFRCRSAPAYRWRRRRRRRLHRRRPVIAGNDGGALRIAEVPACPQRLPRRRPAACRDSAPAGPDSRPRSIASAAG